MTLGAFISKYQNQQNVGDTDVNRGQCVGLVEVWFDELSSPHVWGNAKDLYSMAGSGYTKGTTWPAPEGSAIVLDASWGGGVGHTGLSLGDGRIFEQNNPTGSTPHVSNYQGRPKGYIGWILPNNYKSGDNMATKEQLIVLYRLAFPNQPDNMDWVTAWTGKDMSDALQALRDDPSRQGYITQLVNDAAAYERGGSGSVQVVVNGTKYVPSK